ncbi:hypothetical protein PLICRDRAFT_243667 [Plicaturopsis crispa FD-325 SS-3]|nr:hypothetical protein PLICRDRAFT_243667 [Plicaturopsis crispa FD-325 SS-3]
MRWPTPFVRGRSFFFRPSFPRSDTSLMRDWVLSVRYPCGDASPLSYPFFASVICVLGRKQAKDVHCIVHPLYWQPLVSG